MPNYEFEDNARQQGFKMICGVDEAGRGPLAGPVCAAAVILPQDAVIEGLNDSKKLSEKKREKLYDVIIEKAAAYAIATASVEEIEEYNILNATFLAMNRAINGLPQKADYAIIDGDKKPKGITVECEAVVKGDSKSMSVAAASILAKVTRDRMMCEYGEKYPVYGFAEHKGYGTKKHREAIIKYGACDIHRPSFLKKIYEKQG